MAVINRYLPQAASVLQVCAVEDVTLWILGHVTATHIHILLTVE